MPDAADEFDLIARHFRPLAGPGGLDLLDDAALLPPPPGRELVLTVDAIVEGVHFLPNDPPDLVARKLLRVNLSDLAAKAATPLAYLLTISAPRGTSDAWFARFAEGLGQDQQSFQISLLGGDTTSTPGPVSLTVTAIGHVGPGKMVRRSGARAGDGLWVSGTIGDGALGLLAIRGEIADPAGRLADRYRLPQPRLGLVDPSLVRAAMDVSDGLVQDLGHLCRASRVGATIFAERVPRSMSTPEWLVQSLTGGDDYELLMAVGPEQEPTFQAHADRRGIPVTRIGTTDAAPGVRVLDAAGRALSLENRGWRHF
ncbi:MAG: thiamine-phosphate kinase [Acetobacteraceae bacterium]|nr:thiamine-phosphate kinase [Acetobacteraceae bacterium]